MKGVRVSVSDRLVSGQVVMRREKVKEGRGRTLKREGRMVVGLKREGTKVNMSDRLAHRSNGLGEKTERGVWG